MSSPATGKAASPSQTMKLEGGKDAQLAAGLTLCKGLGLLNSERRGGLIQDPVPAGKQKRGRPLGPTGFTFSDCL